MQEDLGFQKKPNTRRLHPEVIKNGFGILRKNHLYLRIAFKF